MEESLIRSAENFSKNSRESSSEGKLVPSQRLSQLNGQFQNIFPGWLVSLLSSYPLAGAEIDFPLYEADEDSDGYVTIRFADVDDMLTETNQSFPGMAIKHLGYLCIGVDLSGSGDPFFIQINEEGNSPVFQVYHDVSDVGEIIEAQGMKKIANSLSEFISKAKVISN